MGQSQPSGAVPNNIVDPRTPQEVQQHIQYFQQNPNARVGTGPNTQMGATSGSMARTDMSGLQTEITGLLSQANQAISRGQWGRATDALERAETSLLNLHSAPGMGSREAGMQEGRALQAITQARQAAASRNRSGVTEALRTAQSETAQLGQASVATGATQPGMTGGQAGGMGQSGMSQSGMGQSGMSQPGMSQPGMMQPRTSSGLVAPGMGTAQPGLVQPGMGSGMTSPGMPAQGGAAGMGGTAQPLR
jgi:hypothetical protein